jgi:hypothetical protein
MGSLMLQSPQKLILILISTCLCSDGQFALLHTQTVPVQQIQHQTSSDSGYRTSRVCLGRYFVGGTGARKDGKLKFLIEN